jgi:trehalose-phosphatase
MPRPTAAAIHNLAAAQNGAVAIVSGRSVVDLKTKFGPKVICVGNHGLEMQGRGIAFVHYRAEIFRDTLANACWDLGALFHRVPGVWVEPKGLTVTVHYRQAPADVAGWIEAAIRTTLQPYEPHLLLRPALKAWEVYPRTGWNKASALGLLLDLLSSRHALLVTAGDDVSDEDIFQAFPDAISIHVGTNGEVPTAARYHVQDPSEMAEFLALVASLRCKKEAGLQPARP